MRKVGWLCGDDSRFARLKLWPTNVSVTVSFPRGIIENHEAIVVSMVWYGTSHPTGSPTIVSSDVCRDIKMLHTRTFLY